MNGRQHQEELLVDAEGSEILKTPEPDADCRARRKGVGIYDIKIDNNEINSTTTICRDFSI